MLSLWNIWPLNVSIDRGGLFCKYETDCLAFASSLCDWSRKLAPTSQTIRWKNYNTHDLVTRVFPRFRLFARFWLLTIISSLYFSLIWHWFGWSCWIFFTTYIIEMRSITLQLQVPTYTASLSSVQFCPRPPCFTARTSIIVQTLRRHGWFRSIHRIKI